MKTELDYYDGKNELPEGSIRISASKFSDFMSKPHQWYRQEILGEERFTGNTSSVIGTCVHYIAEKVAKGEHPDKEQIEHYIANFANNPDVDIDEVRSQYRIMGERLVNDYILKNRPYRVEEFIHKELSTGIFVGGSCDAVNGSDSSALVVDYKTYNSKTKPSSIPMHYKYQLLIYAYIYTKMGVNVDRVRLVYINRNIDGGISDKTGKPLKSYPPEVTVLTESIDQEDIAFIESVLHLLVETLEVAKEHPELVHILFRDMRLKEE